MSLEQHIADLTSSTNALTQTVTDQLGDIQQRVDQAEAEVDLFIQDGAANFPVGPNLIADTKKFTGLCNGQLNAILPWDGGGLGGVWGASWLGATGTLDVEVVYVGDTARLTALGLYPLGDLSQMVEPFPHPTLTDYGLDSNVAIFDLTIDSWAKGQPVAENTVPFAFAHDCLPYTS